MVESDLEVADLLGRVMSRAPAPEIAKPKEETPAAAEAAHPAIAEDEVWRHPGIAGGTRVTTNFGKVPAHLVQVGDRLKTRSGAYRPVKKIQETKLEAEVLELHPDAMPVLIQRGSLAPDCPAQDLGLSPAQVVTVPMRPGMAATQLARDVSKQVQPIDTAFGLVAYYTFELDADDDICCEGIWVRTANP